MNVALNRRGLTPSHKYPPPLIYYVYSALNYLTQEVMMSWDNLVENAGYWLEVASNRMARRALHVEAKSLSKMAEDENIQEWISFMSDKSVTKSLKRDIATIVAKKVAEKATKATRKQDGENCPPNDIDE